MASRRDGDRIAREPFQSSGNSRRLGRDIELLSTGPPRDNSGIAALENLYNQRHPQGQERREEVRRRYNHPPPRYSEHLTAGETTLRADDPPPPPYTPRNLAPPASTSTEPSPVPDASAATMDEDFAQSREPDDLFSDEIEAPDYDEPAYAPPSTHHDDDLPPPPPPPSSGAGASVRGGSSSAQQTSGANYNNNTNNNSNGSRGGRRGYNNNQARSQSRPTEAAAPAPAEPTSSNSATILQPSTSQDAPILSAEETPQPQPPSHRISSVRGDRSATGPAKPTKRTEAELAELMAAMQLKNAAKTQAHARAEADQANFLNREREAAAKRLEERRTIKEQDAERAKNRERKIKAQGGREWDSEKQESDIVDGKSRGNSSGYMRGAYGGVARGPGGGGVLYGQDDDDDFNRRGYGYRGRGGRRGDFGDRGARRAGRGTSGGGRGRGGASEMSVPREQDFPALPLAKPVVAEKSGGGEVEKEKEKEKVKSMGLGESTWAEEVEKSLE